MSSTAKTAIWLVVLIVVIIAGWVWYDYSSSSSNSSSNASVSSYQNSQLAPATPTAADDTSGPAMSSPSDSSDAALDQDMSSVGGQVNGLNSDSANVDQSMSSNSNQTPSAQ